MGRKSIQRTVERPYATSQATNKANGNPSTEYFNRDGSYVVKDNKTGDIIQVSNWNDPNWVPDNTIANPFIPTKR
ncbi:colicin E5-related ribonuclease [Pedobacter sp. SYP-B3415]|uniref:colicin E5-related ribonuclease n=1 Tax=Pedobacter sp. SYP-B3415 TaxID=2496641 RepID=UPI00101B7F9D